MMRGSVIECVHVSRYACVGELPLACMQVLHAKLDPLGEACLIVN